MLNEQSVFLATLHYLFSHWKDYNNVAHRIRNNPILMCSLTTYSRKTLQHVNRDVYYHCIKITLATSVIYIPLNLVPIPRYMFLSHCVLAYLLMLWNFVSTARGFWIICYCDFSLRSLNAAEKSVDLPLNLLNFLIMQILTGYSNVLLHQFLTDVLLILSVLRSLLNYLFSLIRLF